MMTDAQQPSVDVLLPVSTLVVLNANIPEFSDRVAKALEPDDRTLEYPDGSLQFAGAGPRLWSSLQRIVDDRPQRPLAPRAPNESWAEHTRRFNEYIEPLVSYNGYWRNLAPFPKRSYCMWYTREYEKRLGRGSSHVIPGGNNAESPGEYHLSDLLVTVPFRRKPGPAVRTQFAGFLSAWFASVAQRGVLGEGPVAPASSTVDYWSRVAQFSIDLSRSGQCSVNWLTLSLLRFGHDVATVAGVHYDMAKDPYLAGDRDYIEAYWQVERGPVTRVDIPPAAFSPA